MKLAEALLLKEDLQNRLNHLQKRIHSNVTVQEGDSITENPNLLIKEALRINEELFSLIKRIHVTNANSKAISGQPIMNLLMQHDLLKEHHRILQEAINSCHSPLSDNNRQDIRWIKMISVADLQKQADDVNLQIMKSRIEIQSSNWKIELLEQAPH